MSRFARTLLLVRRSLGMADSYHDRCLPAGTSLIPKTASALAILGACGTVLWVMLSVSGYLHEEPRVAQQQGGPLVVALPMPAAGKPPTSPPPHPR